MFLYPHFSHLNGKFCPDDDDDNDDGDGDCDGDGDFDLQTQHHFSLFIVQNRQSKLFVNEYLLCLEVVHWRKPWVESSWAQLSSKLPNVI